MKIAHISDVHIRNLKYHTEYRRVFENLYEKLEELKPDIVVNTGDTAHTKTQISPEFVEMTSEHIRQIVKIAPYHITLGNHDFNLMNRDRQDAITPIVESINDPRVFLHKKSGRVDLGGGFNFWVFSLADSDNYPLPSSWAKHPNEVNIGLFHGSVSTCVTDSNWRMTHVEHDLSIFDGLDYALLGDIHKQQFFNGRRIAYAGSLIQQNFGEELDKGFLFWEIDDKNSFRVTPHTLKGSRKFYTLKLNDDLSIPDVSFEEGSRLRVSPPNPITLVQQKSIEKEVKKRFKPYDVITLSSNNIGTQTVLAGKKVVDVENLRQLAVQERLIRDWLKEKKLSDKVIEKVLELNKKYQVHVEQEDDTARNINWKINKLVWSNLFNYGEGNVIDFDQLGGLTGLFAPNASGKSNLIDVIMETCFDSTTKGVTKNIFLINDNKDNASAVAHVTANDQNYLIERSIERIKYGQRKFEQEKEWGKTSVKFAMVDSDGGEEPLVGTLRPETERNIRQRLGTFDDFMLTSLSAQWNMLDLIACKETKRKEILYKFLDLDVFAEKGLLAKEESKEYTARLRDLEENGVEETARKYGDRVKLLEKDIRDRDERVQELTGIVKELYEKFTEVSGQKVPVDLTRFELGDWAAKIKKAELLIASNTEKVTEINGRLLAVEESITKVGRLESKFDVKMHEEKVTRLGEIDTEIQVNQRLVAGKEQTVSSQQKNVQLLSEVPCGDQYPTCRFLVNAFEAKKKLPTLQDEVKSLKEKIDELVAERQMLLPFKEKLEAYKKFVGEKDNLISRRDNLKLQLENIKLKIEQSEAERSKALDDMAHYEKAEADLKKNEEIDAQLNVIKNQKFKHDSELKSVQKEISELHRQLGSDQGILGNLSSQLETLQELRETCTAFEHFAGAMGKDGIALQILTQKLPLINEEINKILLNAADFGVFIEHDPQEQSIRIFLQYGQYKSRLLELGSGAEKMLASVAIRTALLNISNLPKTNMFIVDEGFGKLDPKNLEAIQRMFDYLKSVFDHVIVISHIDTMKDMVDNIIEITTDDEGYAHVEIGG